MNEKPNQGTTTKRIVTPEAIADLYRRCGAVDLAETVESSLTAMLVRSAAIDELVTAYRNDQPLVLEGDSQNPPAPPGNLARFPDPPASPGNLARFPDPPAPPGNLARFPDPPAPPGNLARFPDPPADEVGKQS